MKKNRYRSLMANTILALTFLAIGGCISVKKETPETTVTTTPVVPSTTTIQRTTTY